jgi:hypothetical protein
MTNPFRGLDRLTTAAMTAGATIGTQYVSGIAARDAFFLAHFEPTALPLMITGTSIFAIVLVAAGSTSLGRVSPDVYVPAGFVASAMLLLGSWGLAEMAPVIAAPLVYLLVSGVGPMLGSGFWLIASERFDPRAAKRTFGLIGGAGTLGGLAGGLVAARVSTAGGVEAMLPLVAVLNGLCAWQIRSWARLPGLKAPSRRAPTNRQAPSGAQLLAERPYLRNLALLVFFITIAAAFADYVFKVQAKTSFGGGAALGSFFSLYYAAVSLLVFVVQGLGSRVVFERLGLSAAMGAQSLAAALGGAVALLVPGLQAIVVMRGSEAVLRASLMRAGHELFYTPIPPIDKRAVKAVVDVGVDRSGDIVGAGIIQMLLWTAVYRQSALLWLTILCSLAALVLAHRSRHGYTKALEQSLLNWAVEVDLGDVEDRHTRTVVLETLHRSRPATTAAGRISLRDTGETTTTVGTGTETRQILALRSRDANAVARTLRGDTVLTPPLVPHVIRLLEWDLVAGDAIRALRHVAEERVGALIDALLDPGQPFVVRRRLARVFSVCVSQRAADGLLLGLEDLRFEVRFHCGRSLAAILSRNPGVRIDAARVYTLARREVAVSRSVWEGRRLLDGLVDGGGEQSTLDELVSDRANRALAHVFTLLGLVLPAEPLRVAYRGLHTTDRGLRGTALEYLESVLPPEVREPLWPFLEAPDEHGRSRRSPDEIREELLASNQSILLNLEQQKDRRHQ